MRFKKLRCFAMAAIMAVLTVPFSAFASTAITTAYEYPISAGSSEWAQYESKQELLDQLQIPNGILQNLTTEALVETVLNYPFFMDIYCYNSPQEGFKYMSKKFNGFSELLSRTDAAETLVSHYQSMGVCTDDRNVTGLNSVYDLSNIEILMGQNDVIDQLNEGELQTLNNVIAEKYTEKLSAPNIYGTTKDAFYQTIVSEPISDDIRNEFISDEDDRSVMAIGVNAPDLSYHTVYTPQGSAVSVTKKAAMTSAEVTSCNNYVSTSYPNATQISGPTNNYNCHSYAWYSASTSNPYWMNDPSNYMSDGSYSSISMQNVAAGDKVYYPYGGHSGIVYYRPYGPLVLSSITLTSKWGGCGLMRHAANYSPYDTTSVSFWN